MTVAIFLSYAREDRTKCDELFTFLDELGVDVFRDVDRLIGGEHWHDHILQKASASKVFIFLASASSINKSGMIQEELEVARQKLSRNESFRFLTVRLDECPLQDWMNEWQFIQSTDEHLPDKIVHSINQIVADTGLPILATGGKAFVNQNPRRTSYQTSDCDYSYAIPTISIVGDQFAASELNSAIRGRVAESILEMRGWVETNLRGEAGSFIDITPLNVALSTKYIGLSFERVAHYAMAAHPEHHFLTINIQRQPWSLRQIGIASENRERLIELIIDELRAEDPSWEPDVLAESLANYDFASNVNFLDDRVRIYFSDYSLGSYLVEAQERDFRTPEIRALLGEPSNE